MKKLIIEKFRTNSGAEYVYDGITGTVIPSNKILDKAIDIYNSNNTENVIDELSQEFDRYEVISAVKFISRWKSIFNGIYKDTNYDSNLDKQNSDFNDNNIKELIENGAMFLLVLTLTEDCNFRCKYCYLSETYNYTRNRTNNYMTLETGKRAIDLYFQYLSTIEKSVPTKKAAITFYGGEPLMNLNLLMELIQYSEKTSKIPITYSMTTNGSLLTDEIGDFIVKYKIHVAISFDGSEENHDSNRVSYGNKPTFNIVYNNIKKFQQRHPNYPNIGIISVYNIKTDLYKNVELFENDDLPPIYFSNQVNDINTEYYNQFTKEDYDKFNKSYSELKKLYIQKKQNGDKISSYLKTLIEPTILPIILRQRHMDSRTSIIPYTGSCIPGMKISVRVDGTIDMCERVNQTLSIGNIDKGLDYGAIKRIIKLYNANFTHECEICIARNTCPLCFAHCNKDSKFILPENFCSHWREKNKEVLSTAYTILEKNHEAFDNVSNLLSTAFEFRF